MALARARASGTSLTGTAYSGISIRELVDPRDLNPSPTEDGAASKREGGRRSRLHSALRRIMAWLFRCDSPHCDYSDPACRGRDAMKESQATRDLQESMLMKRKDRGSIMFERGEDFTRLSIFTSTQLINSPTDTGIARIPLYAAPQSTQIAGAPALSSFAPIAPLGSDAPAKALAKAAATVTIDGRVLEIKKQEAFNRGGGRYSAFVKSSEMSVQLLSPTVVLPHAKKQDSMRVAEIAATDEM